MNKKEKSLEELTEQAEKSWGKILPQFISLNDFETKVKRIARTYGNDIIHQEGSHRVINVGEMRVGWSPRQKGHEDEVSSGVFDRAMKDISQATKIPCEQLEIYFKGSGKLYRKYKQKFEEEHL